MMRLLKIEWAKLSSYKPFWWLSGLYLIMAPLLILFLDQLGFAFFPSAAEEIYGFPTGWNVSAWISSWFQILLGMIIVIFATNEFAAKTARQHIIDGLTRKEFFGSKLLLTGSISIIATAYMAIIAIIASLIYTGGVDNVMNGIEYIPIFLFQTFGYLSIALLFSLLLRSSGYAILLFLCVIFVEWLIRQFLPSEIAAFSPIGVIARLTPFPFLQELIDEMTRNGETPFVLDRGERFAIGTAYILGILFIAYQNVMRRNF